LALIIPSLVILTLILALLLYKLTHPPRPPFANSFYNTVQNDVSDVTVSDDDTDPVLGRHGVELQA